MSNEDNEHSLSRSKIEKARSRAGMYGLLANLLNRRVDHHLVRRLREAGVNFFVPDKKDKHVPEITKGLTEMARYLEAVAEKSEKEVEQELAVDWTRLFRGVSPEYGPPPPYEEMYAQDRDGVKPLEEVCCFYRECGLEIGEETPNRPDYIGIELDFLRYLSEREAEAWKTGDSVSAGENRETSVMFISDHIGRWCGVFCNVAMKYADTGFYRGLLLLIKGTVAAGIDNNGF